MRVSIYTDVKEALYRVMEQANASAGDEEIQYVFDQIVGSSVLESDIILVYKTCSQLSKLAELCSSRTDNKLLVITCFMETDDSMFAHNTVVLKVVERNCGIEPRTRRPVVIFDSGKDATQIVMEVIALAQSVWNDMQKCQNPQVCWIHPEETSCRMVLMDDQGIMVKVH